MMNGNHRIKIFLHSIFLVSSLNSYNCDFNDSCTRYGKSSWNSFWKYPTSEVERYLCAKDLYKKNINRTAKIHGNISKIIHQIWIGNTIPESLQALSKSWQKWPDWKYIVWNSRAMDIIANN